MDLQKFKKTAKAKALLSFNFCFLAIIYVMGFSGFFLGCKSSGPLLTTLSKEYFPLAVGNTWTFMRKDGSSMTITMIGEVEKDGLPVWEVKGFKAGISNYFWVVSSRVFSYDSDVDQSGLWYKYLDLPLVLGNKWSYEVPVGYYQDDQFIRVGEYLYKAKVSAKDKILTKAGSFSDCYKVEYTTTYSPQPSGIAFSKIERVIWFAPDVGWVSFEFKTYDSQGTQLSSEEAILSSYSIK